MDIFEYLEDFDNAELTLDDWYDNMWGKVVEYNEEHGQQYDPRTTILEYKTWQKRKWIEED